MPRNNDPIFWPDSTIDLSIRNSMEKNYTDCINILQTMWWQFDINQRFSMADQDLWGLIYPNVATYRRKIFNFNLINPILQMIGGYQRRNRKSTTCIPISNASNKTADQLTKCLYYVHNNSAYQVYSDAFELGALTQGLGFVSIFVDHSHDPVSGDIRLRYVDPKSTLFDPYFRSHDLSDCRFIWTRQFFDREEAAVLYPEFSDEILSLPRGTYRDDKFYYMPEVYQIQFPNLIAFDEYWYLTSREALYLVDVETNECQEFSGDEEELRDVLRVFRNQLKVIKKQKPTVRRSIIINDKVLIDEPNPYGLDRYPYVPFMAYNTMDTPYYATKFRGVVSDLRDPQFLFNMRKVTDLDILSSQQQGIKVKNGALVTPKDGMNQGNGRMLMIDEKYQMSDVEPMPIIPPAPQLLQMEEMLQDVLHRISGVSPEMMGHDIDDKASVITMMRNSAGTTSLTRLYDQFDESQRICGEIILEMIQKNWTYGKIRQVIGEEPTPEFDNKLFLKYGCKVVQQQLTETQQQLELAQILNLQERFGEIFPFDEVVQAMTIQNKDRILEKMVKAQEAKQQQEQQMAQLQMKQIEVDNETKLGYANSQNSLAQERMSKMQLEQIEAIESLAKTEEQKTEATLNVVKMIKELQEMDLTNLKALVDIANALKQNETKEIDQQAKEISS